MSPMSWASGEVTSRFPRVSGDEPSSLDTSMRIDAFSPRERG